MKTIQQKMLSGTLQKCRMKNPVEYEPLKEIPDPLSKLDNPGKEFFEYVCSLLISNKQLTTADIPAITRAAGIWEIFMQAKSNCSKYGYFQETKSGYSAKNAHIQALVDCEKILTAFEKSYGLTLLSRSKIDISAIPMRDPNDEDFSPPIKINR